MPYFDVIQHLRRAYKIKIHYKRLKPNVREKHYYHIERLKIKNLNKDLKNNEKCLRENNTWIKFILIKYPVDCLLSKENNENQK